MHGLTGSIATGKSTVAAILKAKGAIIIDADEIAKQVVAPGEPGYNAVKKHFPRAIKPDGWLNREYLAQVIFSDRNRRQRLESIIHPLVIDRIKGDTKIYDDQIVFADIPLLFETNCQAWLDAVWVVYTPLEVQLSRLQKRDGLSKQEALLRINAQMSIERKRKLADYVIDNSNTLEQTKIQIDKLWHQVFT